MKAKIVAIGNTDTAYLKEEIKYFEEVSAGRRRQASNPECSEIDMADHLATISAMELAIVRTKRILARCTKR